MLALCPNWAACNVPSPLAACGELVSHIAGEHDKQHAGFPLSVRVCVHVRACACMHELFSDYSVC